MVDHYEPGTGKVNIEIAKERIKKLLAEYPKLADKHKDSGGNSPKRTWFFPPHYHNNYFLKDLVSLCEKGYGEIELHLHHGKLKPDTSENLARTIDLCVKEYSKFGIFGTEKGIKKFGFIHGDWALANSRNNKFCGVNNEIDILSKAGCFADYTFPSRNEANPSQINSIYYAKSSYKKPKSYNTGTEVEVMGKNKDGLMVIQGPIYPYFQNRKLFGLRILGDAITGNPPIEDKRIDAWIKTGITVKGKEDWIIVKTHTHGAIFDSAVLGEEMNDIYNYLENKYNDGKDYILHYVTARELYNIIKAAEAGEPGSNPVKYKDYVISSPQYDSSPDIHEASKKLLELIFKTYKN